MTKRYDDMHFMMMPIDRQSDQSADVGLRWSFEDMIIWWCDVKIDWWHDNYSMMTKRYDYILFMMIQIDRQTDQSSKVGQPWCAYFRKWSCLLMTTLIIYVAYYQVSKYLMKGFLMQEVKNKFISIEAV